jgi:hypothetical protein
MKSKIHDLSISEQAKQNNTIYIFKIVQKLFV